MSLLTAQIVKNCTILAGLYFIFLKERARPNLRIFQYQIVELSEKIRKVVTKKDQFEHFFAT